MLALLRVFMAAGLIALLCVNWAPRAAAQLSADDFLPPAAAPAEQKVEARAIQEPSAIVETTDPDTGEAMVTGASQQDAVNAGLKVFEGGGCQMVMGPSGRAWVARGTGQYRMMENVNATRIDKRKAYVVALMNAKRELASTLRGLSNNAKTIMSSELVALDAETDSLFNSTEQTSESIDQSVEAVLRGYVIYDVEDKTDTGEVFVSIVTSPKTRGELQRPTPDSLTANSVSEGLNHVFTEINNGVVAPVGGKIVSVPQTGEVAFVGFGAAVIRYDENAALQSRLRLSAQRIADARARDALFAIIQGEQLSSRSLVESSTDSSIRDFADVVVDDPLAQESPKEQVIELEQRMESFRSTESVQEEIASIRNGVLPPGVAMKSFTDAEDAWVYSVAVYTPSMTQAAADDAKAMEDAQIVQPVGTNAGQNSPSGTTGTVREGFTDRENSNAPTPSQNVGQGATGTVTSDF